MNYEQYNIIKSTYIEDLIDKVNQAIKEGWEPLGGMTVEIFQGFPPHYFQTIVKKSND